MEKNNMTAVNWLMQNIEKTLPNFMKAWRVEFEKAKQMEKEQIMSAYKADRYPCSYDDAEDYYNQTYKTQAQ